MVQIYIRTKGNQTGYLKGSRDKKSVDSSYSDLVMVAVEESQGQESESCEAETEDRLQKTRPVHH